MHSVNETNTSSMVSFSDITTNSHNYILIHKTYLCTPGQEEMETWCAHLVLIDFLSITTEY